ncbi:MAG: peptidoglycan DD-metalloendopeptidase family protein [Desulfobacula sp.]|nr:peptidoglycan DD-metalloendopeptidase family protein [Desulfobacula sp.]
MQIVKGIVKNGDTATSLLHKYLSLQSIYEIDRQSSEIFSLTHIRRGQPYRLILKENDLVGFEYEIDKEDKLVIENTSGTFSINQQPIQYDVNVEVISASINYSLFAAVRKSGEMCELAMKLSDIFAWDIDFIRDIQPGDHFKVLVEKRYRDGKLSGYGKILAAFFTNKGTLFKAFLHQSGYYDENGKSLQKAFLKAPLAFSRISSKFTKKRFHPILKVYRPHQGIDYAASKGTPIKTVGDGTIAQIGYNKGKGNYIKIRHYNGYTTSYYHMCKFGADMKKNRRVLQGDTIGYVGMTGYATGHHLCFRMKENGKHIDPLKHKSPSAKPVKGKEMEQYIAKTINLSNKMSGEQQLASLKN